jgi:Protein O-mannosyl-transferase TMEM260-like
MLRRTAPGETERRFDEQELFAAAAIAVATLGLFLRTLCPAVYIEDSPELAAAGAVLGVPHSPGYPLYTMLEALFIRAVPVGGIAYRANLFSAVCGALTAGALWLMLRRRLRVGRPAALASALCFVLGRTFWSQCLVAEVHALNGLLFVLALDSALAAAERPEAVAFLRCGLTAGLLVGHRNVNALFLPAFLAMLEDGRRRAGAPHRLWLRFAGGFAASALVYLYLPLAARRDPGLAAGAPSTWTRLWATVSARSYFRHLGDSSVTLDLGRALRFAKGLPVELGPAAAAAPAGFVLWHRRRASVPLLALSSMAALTFGFGVLYNVVDVDSYFLPVYAVLAIMAAIAFDALGGAARLATLAAVVPLLLNFASVDLSGSRVAQGFLGDLFRSAPPRALVVSSGDTVTHLLWFGQLVERARPDVVVVSADEISSWYTAELARRHPDVAWPPAAPGPDWVEETIRRNVRERPVCLTHPLAPDLAGWRLVPRGLLFCLRPTLDRDDLRASVAFWSDPATSTPETRAGADVHVQMLAFAYASSRFALAHALAETGDVSGANGQLTALLALHPDDTEDRIAEAMKDIGHPRFQHVALGVRARELLSADR